MTIRWIWIVCSQNNDEMDLVIFLRSIMVNFTPLGAHAANGDPGKKPNRQAENRRSFSSNLTLNQFFLLNNKNIIQENNISGA